MRTLFSQAQLCNKLIKSNLADQGLVVDDFLLFVGNLHIKYGRRQSGERRILIPSFLHRVEHVGSLGCFARSERRLNDAGEVFFADRSCLADKFGIELES